MLPPPVRAGEVSARCAGDFFALSGENALRGGTFVRRQKYPKAPLSSAGSCNFGCSLRGSIQNHNKADGMRLPREGRHIETSDTADDGGGNVACAVWIRRPVAAILRKCEVSTNLRTSVNFHRKSTQCALNASRMQSLHLNYHRTSSVRCRAAPKLLQVQTAFPSAISRTRKTACGFSQLLR